MNNKYNLILEMPLRIKLSSESSKFIFISYLKIKERIKQIQQRNKYQKENDKIMKIIKRKKKKKKNYIILIIQSIKDWILKILI